ncbi:unnamed protein product, partial [Vitis vinifera]|uniref:Uncharacterized protein n=1 Tax=Vitis vinifera TaxID=29760 RepID=D7U3U5_VITVI
MWHNKEKKINYSIRKKKKISNLKTDEKSVVVLILGARDLNRKIMVGDDNEGKIGRERARR